LHEIVAACSRNYRCVFANVLDCCNIKDTFSFAVIVADSPVEPQTQMFFTPFSN
jgi:hypothetical protein